ncbi:hypothetical protein [Pseudonocardia acaciae]|uniref:hypothetical protein n=1 Tax=Pseudonocardia acaciae TaxID=551276 RepID=UPI000491DB57|nr:hypothetical protein [Pseudonocardia acaciae]
MADIDSVRVFRGIYGGFALAMTEGNDRVHFDQLPSSDDMARTAFDITRRLITNGPQDGLSGAQQELTSTIVALALVERGGKTSELTPESITEALPGLSILVRGGGATA